MTTGGSPLTWTYSYNGDELTSVCPPTSTTACTTYAYSSGADSGSHYRSTVLDAGPTSYWRLDDASGTTATDAVATNEGNDNGTYSNVTLGAAGALPGTGDTAASFNGTSSYVSLPEDLLDDSTYLTVELWFKTTQAGGVLFSYQNQPIGSSTKATTETPALYVGTDGKLHGCFDTSGCSTSTLTSTAAVDDGQWHQAVLVGQGTSQSLYLDGTAQGAAKSGTITTASQPDLALGAGYVPTGWPDVPSDTLGHFQGSIDEVSVYTSALGAPAISQQYAAGAHAATELTQITLPSGKTAATVLYDTGEDRASQVTDSNGGTWTLGSPSVAGSSDYYRGAVMASEPMDYWRLGESSGTDAANEVWGADGDATYDNVTLGEAGLNGAAGETAAGFNGTSSNVSLPQWEVPGYDQISMEMWFKTTTAGGVLFSYQSVPIGTSGAGQKYTPALYVGSDGKLYGEFWDGAVDPMNTPGPVDDGKWHQVVMTGQYGHEDLYLDGKEADSLDGGDIAYTGQPYGTVGAGYIGGSWPQQTTANSTEYFKGTIGEVSFYKHTLSASDATTHYAARGASTGPTPQTTVQVTDPGSHPLSFTYDPQNAGRMTGSTNALGYATTYTYDTDGFLETVNDPDDDVTTYGHDARGNEVSETTCQSQTSCQTSYAAYYLNPSNPVDPRNDEVTSTADARSDGPDNTTYATTYTYYASGDLETAGTPATSDFPSGRTTTDIYTTGTEAAAGGGSEPPGLPATRTDPRGEETSYTYDSAGDVATVTSPSGAVTSYTYDNLGRRLTSTQTSDAYPQGVTVSSTWDGQNRPVTITGPATTDAVTGVIHTPQTGYTYDADGDVLTSTAADTTGGDSTRTQTYTYDDHDRVATSTNPLNRTTTYGYDDYGDQTSVTDPAGNQYTYTYSPTGEQLTETLENWTGNSADPSSPQPLLLDSRAYDPYGSLATDTDAMSRTTGYYYNGDHELTDVALMNYLNTDGSTTERYLDDYVYDAAGNVSAHYSADYSVETAYTVDAADRVDSAAFDPGGLDRTTTYTYDADDETISQALTDGTSTWQTDYTFDALGDETSQTVHDGSSNDVTTWGYDQRGLVTSMTDPRGNAPGADAADYTTDYANDQAGRQTQITGPLVSAETDGGTAQQIHPIDDLGYDTFGDVTSTDDPDGLITTYTYDADGERTALSEPAYTAPGSSTSTTPTESLTYDQLGNVATDTDPNGAVTTSHYDQLDDLVEQDGPQTNGSTPVATFTYDNDGEQLSATDPTGAQTRATYDNLGQQLTATQIVRQPVEQADTTTYNYDDNGDLTSVTDPLGNKSTSTYDTAGEQLTATDPLGNKTSYAYDAAGDQTQVTYPDQTATTATYSPAGDLTATTDLDSDGNTLSTESYGYDPAGNQTSATDGDQHTTNSTYDAEDQLVQQVQPVTSSSSISTSFGYDAAGDLTRYTDGDQNATIYTYNTLGLRESTIEPATTGYTSAADRTTTTSYDADGNPVQVTQPGGVTQQAHYDAEDRLTSETGSGGEAATAARSFGYDADGRLTSAATPAGTDTYTYDDNSDLLTSTSAGRTTSYTYDTDGRPASRTDTSGTATYTYDADSDLATATDPLTGTTATYGYNSLGQLTSQTYGTGAASQSYSYNSAHELTQQSVADPSGTTEASIGYGYDDDGRVTSQTTTGLAGAGTSAYGYDQAGRLTSWTHGSTTTAYGYDADGNRTSAGGVSATYNTQDELVSAGGTTYGYTARGTLASTTTTSGTTTDTSDAFGQTITDGSTTYAYDALGRVTSAGSANLAYEDQSDNPAADGTDSFDHTPDGSLLAVSSATGSALALTDAHGDLSATFTAAGTALNGSVAYDPWGSVTATSGDQYDIGYQGGWTDPDSGNIATASRWYNPSMGGFTSHDTTQQAPVPAVAGNPYAYADDDPLDNADPSGDSACQPDTASGSGTSGGWTYGYESRGGYSGGGSSSSHSTYYRSQPSFSYREAEKYFGDVVEGIEALQELPELFNFGGGGGHSSAGSSAGAGYVTPGMAAGEAESESEAQAQADAQAYAWLIADEFAEAAGWSSCDVTVQAPAPPPPPDAADGLAENPGKRPTGTSHAKGDVLQNGTKTKATGSSDQAPVSSDAGAPPNRTVFQPLGNAAGPDPSSGASLPDADTCSASMCAAGALSADPLVATQTAAASAPGSGGGTNSRQPSTCLNNPIPGSSPNTSNGGWDYYAPLGYGGRSEGAVVCAAKKNPTYNQATHAPGFAAAAAANPGRINNCHLAPSVLGGSGASDNVATCWRKTNVGTPSMRTFEYEAQKAVESKLVVTYVAVPVYASRTSTIPRGFQLSYLAQSRTGGPSRSNSVYVANDGRGQFPNLGN